MSNPYQDRVDVAKSLFGVLSNHMTLEEARDALQSRVPFAEAAQKFFIYSAHGTRKILNKLFTLFHLLDTTSLDCRKAISSEIDDYENAIMVETAIHSEMDCIVTRNMKDYTKSSVSRFPKFH